MTRYALGKASTAPKLTIIVDMTDGVAVATDIHPSEQGRTDIIVAVIGVQLVACKPIDKTSHYAPSVGDHIDVTWFLFRVLSHWMGD